MLENTHNVHNSNMKEKTTQWINENPDLAMLVVGLGFIAVPVVMAMVAFYRYTKAK